MQVVEAKSKKWEYYPKDEADELGIVYLDNWRAATEAGQCVLTDTGWVVPVYAVFGVSGKLISHGRTVVRIPTGTFLSIAGNRMTHEKREDSCSLTGKKFKPKDPARRLTALERRFVQALLELGDIYMAYAQASSADTENEGFRKQAQKLARRANVARALDSATRETLGELGIDKRYVLEQMKILVGDVRRTPGGTRLKALEKFAEYLGMEPEEESPWTRGQMVFPGHSPEEVNKQIAENESRAKELTSGDSRGHGSAGSEEARTQSEDVGGHGPVREDDLPESPVQKDTDVPRGDLPASR